VATKIAFNYQRWLQQHADYGKCDYEGKGLMLNNQQQQ
jgi:hypothetical protein